MSRGLRKQEKDEMAGFVKTVLIGAIVMVGIFFIFIIINTT